MLQSNWSQFFRWSIVGAVAGLGVVGFYDAIGQSATRVSAVRAPAVTVDGMRVAGQFSRADQPKLMLYLNITNPSPNSKTIDTRVTLVKREFKGSPVSRVFRPDDFKLTAVVKRSVHLTVAGRGKADTSLVFDLKAPSSEIATSTYIAQIPVGGKDVTLVASPPPANVVLNGVR